MKHNNAKSQHMSLHVLQMVTLSRCSAEDVASHASEAEILGAEWRTPGWETEGDDFVARAALETTRR